MDDAGRGMVGVGVVLGGGVGAVEGADDDSSTSAGASQHPVALSQLRLRRCHPAHAAIAGASTRASSGTIAGRARRIAVILRDAPPFDTRSPACTRDVSRA